MSQVPYTINIRMRCPTSKLAAEVSEFTRDIATKSGLEVIQNPLCHSQMQYGQTIYTAQCRLNFKCSVPINDAIATVSSLTLKLRKYQFAAEITELVISRRDDLNELLEQFSVGSLD